MTDDLDTILSSDEVVTPSFGFISSVMRAVHQSCRFTGTIPFPWFRFATGLIGGLLCLIFSVFFLLSKDPPDLRFIDIASWAQSMDQAWMIYVVYSTFVFFGSLLAVRFSFEFISE
ncbi:MAG: hypothetical protein KJ645_11800 [Planctomycetes bacterium]|nr:hypothetical protein [Planctomycetota bacterium]